MRWILIPIGLMAALSVDAQALLNRNALPATGSVYGYHDTPYLSPGRAGDSKAPLLSRLKSDGVFLIDLVPFPVNGLSPRERAKARCDHLEACVRQACELAPSGIVVCHGPSFHVLAAPMRAAGLPLLHEQMIPFPIGNWRAGFVEKVRLALARLDS